MMIALSFLFDNYGLYPNDLVDNSFIIDDKLYKVEEIKNYSEEDMNSLVNFSIEIKKVIGKDYQIIKNRKNQYITRNVNANYVLISVPIYKVNYYDIINFNMFFQNKNINYKVSQMIDIWLERYTNIQNSCFNALNNEDKYYNDIYIAVSYSFGLAENAISYLADAKLDYGDEIERLVLSHVRLNSLDSYSFLNPLNMIYDSIVRDYAELYKFNLIDLIELNKITDYLNLTQKEATLLMARVLYPTKVFDILEDNYLNDDYKFNKASEYFKTIDKELQRIKNLHKLLIKKYNIRPIKWLLK